MNKSPVDSLCVFRQTNTSSNSVGPPPGLLKWQQHPYSGRSFSFHLSSPLARHRPAGATVRYCVMCCSIKRWKEWELYIRNKRGSRIKAKTSAAHHSLWRQDGEGTVPISISSFSALWYILPALRKGWRQHKIYKTTDRKKNRHCIKSIDVCVSLLFLTRFLYFKLPYLKPFAIYFQAGM